MADFDNTNRGALFRNDKGDNAKRPDYTGKLNVGGVDYKLSAWLREGAKGKFLSLSVQPVEEQRPAPKATPKPAVPEFDDDLAF
jgi:hypothetical protein